MFTIAFKTEEGRTAGWLSVNFLMAKKRENALELPEGRDLRHYLTKAELLLAGPHPLDHHGPVRVAVEETPT